MRIFMQKQAEKTFAEDLSQPSGLPNPADPMCIFQKGIAYVGGITNDGKKTPKDTRTPAQRVAIVQLVKKLKELYGSHITIHGHNEFAAKECPSFKIKDDLELCVL